MKFNTIVLFAVFGLGSFAAPILEIARSPAVSETVIHFDKKRGLLEETSIDIDKKRDLLEETSIDFDKKRDLLEETSIDFDKKRGLLAETSIDFDKKRGLLAETSPLSILTRNGVSWRRPLLTSTSHHTGVMNA
jgi:hypothetical protein